MNKDEPKNDITDAAEKLAIVIYEILCSPTSTDVFMSSDDIVVLQGSPNRGDRVLIDGQIDLVAVSAAILERLDELIPRGLEGH